MKYIIFIMCILNALGLYAQQDQTFLVSSSPKGITVFIADGPLSRHSQTGWVGYQIYRSKTKDGKYKKLNRDLLAMPEDYQDFAMLLGTKATKNFKEHFKTDEKGIYEQFLKEENKENAVMLAGFDPEIAPAFGLIFHDEHVKKNTTYYYKLAKVKSDGKTSELSKPVESTYGKPLFTLRPPTDLKAYESGEGVLLRFSKAEEHAYRYVYRSEDSLGSYLRMNELKIVGNTDKSYDSYVDTSAKRSVKYYYTVASGDLFNNQYHSDTVSFTRKGKYDFKPPIFTTIDNHDAGVALNWEMEFPEGQVIGFEILRRPNVNDTDIKYTRINQNYVPANVRHYVDQTPEMGKSYQYAVRAVASDEMSRYTSIPGVVFAQRVTRPLPPQNVKVEPRLKAIQVSWDSVPGSDIAGYMVFRGYSDSKQTETLSDFLPKEQRSFVDSSKTLSKNITFAYYIKTFTHGEYESILSKPVFASPLAEPYKPKRMNSLSGTYSEFKGNQVQWGIIMDKETRFVRLFRSEADTAHWQQIYQEKATHGAFTYQDTTRNPLKTYYYKMCAVSFDDVNSDFSDILTIKPRLPKVMPPQDLNVEQKGNNLKISWLPVIDDYLKSYAVYRQSYTKELEKIAEIPKNKTSFEDKIEVSDKYTYFVRSVNMMDEEGKSTSKISYDVEL